MVGIPRIAHPHLPDGDLRGQFVQLPVEGDTLRISGRLFSSGSFKRGLQRLGIDQTRPGQHKKEEQLSHNGRKIEKHPNKDAFYTNYFIDGHGRYCRRDYLAAAASPFTLRASLL